MIAFRVKLNGQTLCLAGAEDLSVLNAIVTANGRLGERTREEIRGKLLHLTVSGLTRRSGGDDCHLRWDEFRYLSVGDRIEIEIVEVDSSDQPTSEEKADRERFE